MSNLTAVAYYAGIPPNNNNLEKPQILNYFCQGVVASGDIAVAHTTTKKCCRSAKTHKQKIVDSRQ